MAALSQTAGNVVAGANMRKTTVTAGGTITAGMPVYKDASDSNKYKAAKANALSTSVVAGIALNGASNNQPMTITSGGGDINLGDTLTVGETYCLSDATAGQIVPIGDLNTGDYTVILGIAETSSNLILDIQTAGVAKA
jgi:hypothetical protein